MAEVTKADVVRQAFKRGKTEAGEIVAYAKRRGVQLTKQYVYSMKTSEKKKEEETGGTSAKPATANTAGAASKKVGSGLADDVKTIKGLKQKYGGNELKRLVDVVA